MNQYPLNGDYITECNPDCLGLASEAVQLAMAILTAKNREELVRQAREIVSKYADWQNITILSAGDRHILLVKEYGIDEVEAMKRASEICGTCGIQLPPALHPLKDREHPEHSLCDECHTDKYA